jgi:hypothetical protein
MTLNKMAIAELVAAAAARVSLVREIAYRSHRRINCSALAILGSRVAARGRLGGRVILHEARRAISRWPRGHG